MRSRCPRTPPTRSAPRSANRSTSDLGDGTRKDFRLVAIYDRSLGFADVLLPWESAGEHLTDALVLSWSWSAGATSGRPLPLSRLLHRDHPTSAGRRPGDHRRRRGRERRHPGLGQLPVARPGHRVRRVRRREHADAGDPGPEPRVRPAPAHRRLAEPGATHDAGRGHAPDGAGLGHRSSGRGGHADAVLLRRHRVSVPALPPLHVGAVLLGSAVLAWVATMVPTRGTMRTRPVDAIGIRD